MAFSYRSILIKIDSELHPDDIESLKFLCRPFVPQRRLVTVDTGHQLFELLEISGKIGEDDSTLLRRLLDIIGRRDLYEFMKGKVQVDSERFAISQDLDPFYETLYKISEEMGPDDVKRLWYLFGCAKNKVITSGIQLFTALLERNEIGPSKLDTLFIGFQNINRKDLIDILSEHKDAFSKQEPTCVSSSSLKFPLMETEVIFTPGQDENLKTTNYFSQELLQQVASIQISEGDSGFGDKGKIQHPTSASESFSDTSVTEVKGHASGKPTNYLTSIMTTGQLQPMENVEPTPTTQSFPVLPRYKMDANPRATGQLQPAENVEPTPATQSFPVLPRYKMDAKPRGVCLVIDNEKFSYDPRDCQAKLLKDRSGSHTDTENIKDCFTTLNFDMKVYPNQTDREMIDRFQECSTDADANKEHDCFVAFILSHGGMENGNVFVYGSNGRKVYLNDIIQMFRPDVCPSLLGKPKLFFLACCLGRSYSKAVPIDMPMTETKQGHIEKDSDAEVGWSRTFVCNDQDFLIGYSTVKDSVSFRDTTEGTWYITELTRIFSQYYQRESLQHMLVLVNDSVSKRHVMCYSELEQLGKYAQVPSPQHTLTKQLWF